MKDPKTAKLLTRMLRRPISPGHSGRETRRAAAKALVKVRDPGAVGPLIAALKDRETRYWAAEALGAQKDARATRPLIECLTDENTWAHGRIARALRQINAPRTVEWLRDLQRSSRPRGRLGALYGLAAFDQIDALIDSLADEDEEVRRMAHRLLRNMTGEDRGADPAAWRQ